ncbi:MAG: hypothetical protein ABR956_07525 [Terracidiphilus sp.]|jgi:hypothetical protein
MTDDAAVQKESGADTAKAAAQSVRRDLLPLPGLVAISLYLVVLAVTVVVGVTGQRHDPPLLLILAVAFIAAGAGLLLLLRWAWAMALAAFFLLAVYNLWIFAAQHLGQALVQGLLNLVFFLYLVRPEVRGKLR